MFGIFSEDPTRELPWPVLEVPSYIEGDHGEWFVKENTPPPIRGYFNGLRPVFSKNYVLIKKPNTVFMSCTPMETESQAPHVAHASGNVLIGGLGMGLYLYNVLKSPKVHSVTVVEESKDVLNLLFMISRPVTWEGFDKLKMVQNDIKEYIPEDPVDFLYMDLWPDMGSTDALWDTKKVAERIKPKHVGFWGQELEFIHWCSENNVRFPPQREAYKKWVETTGLPLVTNWFENPSYWATCAAYHTAMS